MKTFNDVLKIKMSKEFLIKFKINGLNKKIIPFLAYLRSVEFPLFITQQRQKLSFRG